MRRLFQILGYLSCFFGRAQVSNVSKLLYLKTFIAMIAFQNTDNLVAFFYNLVALVIILIKLYYIFLSKWF
jgi:hypothetical protein